MYCLNNQISLLIQVAITNENHYLVYQCIGTGGSDCALSIDWLIKTNTTLWARSPRLVQATKNFQIDIVQMGSSTYWMIKRKEKINSYAGYVLKNPKNAYYCLHV